MKSLRPLNSLLSISLILCLLLQNLHAEDSVSRDVSHEPVTVYEVEGSFDDVQENLKLAIESHGLVISYVSYASDMLRRTADVTGNKPPVYGDAQSVFFCKADISDRLVRADPHHLVFCPFSISVYTLASDEQTVYLSHINPGINSKEYDAVTALLTSVIDETINF